MLLVMMLLELLYKTKNKRITERIKKIVKLTLQEKNLNSKQYE